jgi:uncharacterized repeat protein (TIGR03803 family)
MKNLRIGLVALNLALIGLAAPLAHGQIPGITFTPLAAFGSTNGANPYAAPVLGADGKLYGVAPSGGTNSVGTNNVGLIYQVATNGIQKTLHTFNKWDGANPVGSLASGQDGNLYGVASGGGTNSHGTIFEITTNGAFTLLYSFGMATNELGYALDGSSPYGGMVQGRDGNFYGVTYSGGISNLGTVFQFSGNKTLTVLHSFTGNGGNDDGAQPYTAPLVEDAPGIFYGTASAGGANNDGTIFQITANGVLTNLFEFNGADGGNPYAGLSLGSDGSLYGATVYGGTNNVGTLFQITTNGVQTTLFQFGGSEHYYYPEGGVVAGNNNTLFGTTYQDTDYGSVFQLTTHGVFTLLHSFTNGADGANPYAGLMRDADGNLYGTALYGGTLGGYGTVYRLSFKTILAILSPTPNQLWGDDSFTVTGTASDNALNGAVTNVFYALNGGAWASATTTNGWDSWTAGLTLVPGSNTVAAYAVDDIGNVSPTNTVSFDHTPIAILTVTTNGLGSVSNNYNGTILKIGATYSMVATAATGFTFVNWTGGTNLPLTVLTSGAALQFTMVTNLMLQANFLDKTRPALSITNVTAAMNVSNAVFTVAGDAGDNWQLTNVFYSLNHAGWSNAVTANGWTNWSAAVTLVPGTNTIAAYAVDPGGQASLTNSVTFQYVLKAPLTVTTNGLGSLNHNYNGTFLQIGENYSLTATPGTGFVFSNWTGGITLPLAILTNGPTVQFAMVTNLMLQANFLDVTKPALTITAPASGQHLPNALATVAGKASDNWNIAGVWYQLNGGTWSQPQTTNGWTNWSATVELRAATNTLKAYAVDLGGNFSTTNSVSFVSTNAFALQLVFTSAQPLAASGLNFALQLSPGLAGHVQVSTNLTSWLTLTNFAGTNSTLYFLDAAATNSSQRFYRAVIP